MTGSSVTRHVTGGGVGELRFVGLSVGRGEFATGVRSARGTSGVVRIKTGDVLGGREQGCGGDERTRKRHGREREGDNGRYEMDVRHSPQPFVLPSVDAGL